MIEIRFANKLAKHKMFKAFAKALRNTKYYYNLRMRLFADKIVFFGAFDYVQHAEYEYEETENGIIFHIGMRDDLAKLFYYYFPRTFKMDAYIFFDGKTYFYSFDEFLKIEKGKVYKMKLDDIREIEYAIPKESIREDILEIVEESKR